MIAGQMSAGAGRVALTAGHMSASAGRKALIAEQIETNAGQGAQFVKSTREQEESIDAAICKQITQI